MSTFCFTSQPILNSLSANMAVFQGTQFHVDPRLHTLHRPYKIGWSCYYELTEMTYFLVLNSVDLYRFAQFPLFPSPDCIRHDFFKCQQKSHTIIMYFCDYSKEQDNGLYFILSVGNISAFQHSVYIKLLTDKTSNFIFSCNTLLFCLCSANESPVLVKTCLIFFTKRYSKK